MSTICRLPWTNFGVNTHGTVRVCGYSKPNKGAPSLRSSSVEDAWNSEHFRKIRREMLAGIEPENCEKCFVRERHGGTSKRQAASRDIDHDHIRSLTAEDGSINVPPTHIDIRTGNICNLKCVHCWTGNSSKWFEDKPLLDRYENTARFQIDNDWIKPGSDIWSYVINHAEEIVEISFLGGEPFASPGHRKLITELRRAGKRHLRLRYVTNGILLTDDLLDDLLAFASVDISVSLDALGAQAELLRFPTKWEVLDERLRRLDAVVVQNPNLQAKLNWTAYAPNIWRLPETLHYARTSLPNMQFVFADYVIAPAHMSIQVLPQLFKEEIAERLTGIPESEFYVNYMLAEDRYSELGIVLIQYLDDLDRVRGTDWRSVLPELAKNLV